MRRRTWLRSMLVAVAAVLGFRQKEQDADPFGSYSIRPEPFLPTDGNKKHLTAKWTNEGTVYPAGIGPGSEAWLLHKYDLQGRRVIIL